ncbi:MAG: tRNA (adenosine(37)-N6)-dimethylallyltransferase MiaA [Alloprevotella sp.]|nr:tRNA (adenosine(37)-N6)-dimethylallyltransferase MiaA [Alloprevotella sp.]
MTSLTSRASKSWTAANCTDLTSYIAHTPSALKTLLVLTGPTAVGKTQVALRLAARYGTPVLNADSRQIYRDLPIGTAAPTPQEQAQARHYFVGTLGLDAYYSAAQYEADVLALLPELFRERDVVLLSGGSMLYIDAVCNGLDDIPTIEAPVRAMMQLRLESEGLDALVEELRLLDPEYFAEVDRRNTRRVVHALEVLYQTGRKMSSFRRRNTQERPFRMVKVALNRPRAELFERINRRVTQMMDDGFWEELLRVKDFRGSNALNTVGYKELFHVLDGEWELPFALDRIRKNTRVYAKKQLTWFRRDPAVHWVPADDAEALDRTLLACGL